MNQSPRHRAVALVRHEDAILLVYRKNERGEYYIAPGGGIDPGETPQQAAERELLEEAGVVVEIGEPLTELHESDGRIQYFFWATLAEGVLPDRAMWQEEEKQTTEDFYRVEWISLSSIQEIDLRPLALKDALL